MFKKITRYITATSLLFTFLTVPVFAEEISPFAYIDIQPQIQQTPSNQVGQVLGVSTTLPVCDTTSLSLYQSGFYGQYYNMSETDPGMKSNTTSYNKNLKIGGDNYWYQDSYRVFDRIDTNLNFGKNFFPVNTGKVGDPYNFAVHWSAVVNIQQEGKYKFTLKSDDDSWLLIDNETVINNGGGAVNARTRSGSVNLTAGYHQVDIYFSQRGVSGSYFSFSDNNENLVYRALPSGCTVNNFTSVNQSNGGGRVNNTGGRVLGASTSAYTPAIALYKTANSPAVYAIYANGYKHYITSPTSFYNYGYSFSDVQTVSEAKLNSYPDVRLVRTPEDETIYFIYTRADKQWLKIPIPSPTAFVSYTQNHWGNVVIIDELDRNAYPDAELITANNGNTIYLLKNGEKHRFASIEVLRRLDYNPAEVVSISQSHLDSYKTGAGIN